MFIGRMHVGLLAAVAVLVACLGLLGSRAALRYLDPPDAIVSW